MNDLRPSPLHEIVCPSIAVKPDIPTAEEDHFIAQYNGSVAESRRRACGTCGGQAVQNVTVAHASWCVASLYHLLFFLMSVVLFFCCFSAFPPTSLSGDSLSFFCQTFEFPPFKIWFLIQSRNFFHLRFVSHINVQLQ